MSWRERTGNRNGGGKPINASVTGGFSISGMLRIMMKVICDG
jgi:hypothetical protein